MEILSVQNCSRFYGRGALQIAALDHVSFTVNKASLLRLSDLPDQENQR